MNRAISYAALLLALLVSGCGGSSTGSSSGTNNGSGIAALYEINGSTSSTPPAALSSGNQMTLAATSTVNGVTTALSLSNFVVSGGSSVGTVSTAGVFTAGSGVKLGVTYGISASSTAGTVNWKFTGGQPYSGSAAGATVEAVIYQVGNTADPYQPVVEDPVNIQIGELIDFQLVAYDAQGGRHVLAASNWSWNDNSNQYGSLDPASGLFTVGQTPTPGQLLVNATYNGQIYGAYYQVNPYQARIIGQVVGSDTGAGLRGIQLTFYDSTLNVTAQVTTSYDGTFRASSKLSAVSFTVNPNSIPSTYWQSFSYGLNPLYISDPTQPKLLTYDAGSDICNTAFQTLYGRGGNQLGTTLIAGENFLFAPAQPSTILKPVTPSTPGDPGLIVINARSTYPARPNSNGCSG